MEFKCCLKTCSLKFVNLRLLTRHLKQHIKEGHNIDCPFADCQRTYNVVSSFSSHLSGVHHSCEHLTTHGSNYDTLMEFPCPDVPNEVSMQSVDVTSSPFDDSVKSTCSAISLQDKYALLYLRLQYEFLIPASTIDVIVKEHEVAVQYENSARYEKLRKVLLDCNVDSETINEVMNKVSGFSSFHEISQILSSPYRRQQYYKGHFDFVSPVCMSLSTLVRDDKQDFFQYIPILESIKFLFQNATIRQQFQSPPPRYPGILRDFCDGENFQANDLFQSSGSLQIILYQDSFEIVNPLGPAKSKHKILAVYFTLANIYLQHRSKVAPIQLVMLAKEKEVLALGHAEFFKPLLNDLKR